MARTMKVEVPVASQNQTRLKATKAHHHEPSASSSPIAVEQDTDMVDLHDVDQNAASTQNPNQLSAVTNESPETLDYDSDTGLELLGQGMKAFVTLIQDLRDLGVEELVLPLPKICVLGDQSTGKSSLIEGISGIKVPRSVGTCTRCPLEINLTATNPGTAWRCTIYLQKSYMYEGSQLLPSSGKYVKAQGATRARPLGPWQPQHLPESFLFFRTSNKADIPRALQLAQLATLNPGADPVKYIPGKNSLIDERMQVKFSPNVVRLDITAPDVPNLSFYDLPGVINQAEVPEEEYLVKLVANLAKSYIKTENCINLLAMPMTDDPANSTASKLIHELDAQNRTIGVLTKPDRVQSGESLAQWIDILNGKKFKLGHGYYVVKNNPDPNVNHVVARQEEDVFFTENQPWSHTLSLHHNRFGTLKLQGILSKRLTEQIKSSLPQITERVRSKTAEIIARLKELPEPPEGNLSLKILQKIVVFEREIHKHIDGGSQQFPFQKEWYATVMQFRSTIAFSYPRLSLSDLLIVDQSPGRLPFRPSSTSTPSRWRSEAIAIDSDDEADAAQPYTPTSNSKRKPSTKASQSSPPKRARLQDVPRYVVSPNSATSGLDRASIDRAAPYAKRFSLTEIRNILQDAHVGLPNHIHPEATKCMIKESLSHWDEPLDELLRFTGQSCLAMILERASEVFSIWQGTQFFDVVLDVCKAFFDEKFANQTASAKCFLDIERRKALTCHEDAMRAASERAFATLDQACRNERARAALAKDVPTWDENLTDRVKKDKLDKAADQLGPNPYVDELRALSNVRGYYECAFARFVDNIYQGVEAGLLTVCRDELSTALKQRIGLEEKDGMDPPEYPGIC
ncbi:MAG: hypothetical protein Q9201_003133 [Fulgogasparrea decipioides]